MQIQLPTSSEALLGQLQVTREFTEKFDPEREEIRFAERIINLIRHLGGVDPLVFAIQDEFQYTQVFNRDAELARLNSLDLALKSGVKSLTFA